MKIHESTRADGTLAPVHLRASSGELRVVSDEGELLLPDGALEAVMKRLGGPLETSEPLIEVARLELGERRLLRHVRHLAFGDVIARDFLVLEVPDADPLCVLAVTACAALTHLARASATLPRHG